MEKPHRPAPPPPLKCALCGARAVGPHGRCVACLDRHYRDCGVIEVAAWVRLMRQEIGRGIKQSGSVGGAWLIRMRE